jgi:hypothetical protein
VAREFIEFLKPLNAACPARTAIKLILSCPRQWFRDAFEGASFGIDPEFEFGASRH